MFYRKSSGFFTALAFLSRLGRPVLEKGKYAPGLFWYGAAGFCLGLLCSGGALLPVMLMGRIGLPCLLMAAFCALLWLSLEIWLSRALHWDGLADLGDALGSGGEGEKFVKVLTDSRLGTFGALILILIFLWQLLFLACIFYRALHPPLVFPLMLVPALACAWSRISPLWLAKMTKARPDSFLGKTLCQAMSPGCFRIALMQALLCLFTVWLCGMSLAAILALVLCQIFLLLYLARIAKRNGGLSGDFFGACIELSQFSFLGCACFAGV